MSIGVPKIRGIPLGKNREHTGEPRQILTKVDSEMKSTRVRLAQVLAAHLRKLSRAGRGEEKRERDKRAPGRANQDRKLI